MARLSYPRVGIICEGLHLSTGLRQPVCRVMSLGAFATEPNGRSFSETKLAGRLGCGFRIAGTTSLGRTLLGHCWEY